MLEFPKHWRQLPLKEIVIIKKGKKPLKLANSFFIESVPYLDIDALENKNIKQYADKLTTVIASGNDILIVADGSRSGLITKGVNGAVGSTILCLTPLSIDQDYLFYFLLSNYEYFNKNTTGASIPHLNQKLFLNLAIPIPPVEEQKNIAEDLKNKLIQYENDFKSAETELYKIQQYKKTILDQAVTGNLTESWRKHNLKGKLSSEDELFNLNPIATIYDNQSLRLKVPDVWVITNAISICNKITDGEHQTPNRLKTGALLLSARNIRDGFIDYEHVDYISQADLKKLRIRCDPEQNDVLIVSVGATIGRTSVVRDKKPLFALVRSVLLLKPKISGFFLMYCLQSPILQDFIKENTKGVAQGHLYINETCLLPIPFPSLAEQDEIVKQIEEHLNTASQIEQETSKTLSQIENLRKAIFQMAFSGKLSKNVTPQSNWFSDFKNDIAVKMSLISDEVSKAGDKKKLAILNFKRHMGLKKSIIEILKESPNQELSVDQVWHQSTHFEKINIEGFYEELEGHMNNENLTEKVSWAFGTEDKNLAILKLN